MIRWGNLEPKVVEIIGAAAVGLDDVRLFMQDIGAEVLQQWQHVREPEFRIHLMDLQLEPAFAPTDGAREVDPDLARSVDGFEASDVSDGRPSRVLVDVGGTESVGIALIAASSFGIAHGLAQRHP